MVAIGRNKDMRPANQVDEPLAARRADVVRSIDLPELLRVIGIDEQTREHGRQLAAIPSERLRQLSIRPAVLRPVRCARSGVNHATMK